MNTNDSSQQYEDSFVNVTNDREARPKHWIAALVQMNTEKKVSTQLDKLGFENYVPTQTEIHHWSDRKKKIDRIIIPMVVFVFLNAEDEVQLKKYSFIYKLLSYPGQKKTAIIPNEQIERLKFMLKNADSRVELNDKIFEIGEKVQIVRGPLRNLEGELCYFNSDKPMIAIRIECLGYACVNILKSDVISI